ncbi:MAG: hypothetical protein NVSMB52_05000 [Chloroflexota bacterium]
MATIEDANHCPSCSRRDLLRGGLGIAITGIAAASPITAFAGGGTLPTSATFGGSTPLPTPIPEIDKNGHHNVPPAPYSEPSEIFNFRGQVGTAILAGKGRDGHGRPVNFGGPGTDLRFMHGEYVTADGKHHVGTFVHI